MHSLLSAVEQPPVDMSSPPAAEFTTTVVLAVVFLMFFGWSLSLARRWSTPLPPLVMAGGLIGSLNEPMVDILGHCWFPRDGMVVFTLFDRPIPLWVVISYGPYFGGLGLVIWYVLRVKRSRRAVWTALGVVWALNLLLEIPVLSTGIYTYYGELPFRVVNLPLMWLFINCAGPVLIGVALHRFGHLLTGPRAGLVLALPFAAYFASWVLDFPYFAVLNSDLPPPWRWVGAVVSAALILKAVDLLTTSALRREAAAEPSPDGGRAAVG